MTLDQDLATRWTPSAEQDEAAFQALSAGSADAVTAHLLVNKEHGWWTTDVEVVHLPGVFADRDEAGAVIVAAARAKHEETGKPVSGGWTYHRLPEAGEQAPTSADGTVWKTRWAVFEDSLAAFPEPSWRRKRG